MSVAVWGLPDEKLTLSWCGGNPRQWWRRRLSISNNPAIIHLLALRSHICKNVIRAATLHGVSPRSDPSGPSLHFLMSSFKRKKKSALGLLVKKKWWEKEKTCNCDYFAGVTKKIQKIKLPPMLVFNLLIWTPASVSKFSQRYQDSPIEKQREWKQTTGRKIYNVCCAEQDAPAYIKTQAATLRRVNGGRHLGDSPAERVSLWQWCQQRRQRVCWECRGGGEAGKKEDKMLLERFFFFLCWSKRLMGRLSPVRCTHRQNKAAVALGAALGWMEPGRPSSVLLSARS